MRAIRLVLITCLFSGLVLVNSIFVWPKLLAAAYVLAFSVLLLSPKMLADMKGSFSKPALAGALVALAMLSHGGSAFSILGLALTVILLRARDLFNRSFLLVLLSCAFLYLPWTLYQKFYDPPGDRLLKWHLAGVTHPTSIPLSKTLVTAYGNLSARQILDSKIANVKAVFGFQQEYWYNVGALLSEVVRSPSQRQAEAAKFAEKLRTLNFFYFVPSLGLLMFGPVALLIRFGFVLCQRSNFGLPASKLSAILYLYTGLTLSVWCLLMFIPGSTINHQGSYAANLTAIVAGVLAFWTASPMLGRAVAAFQIFMTFLLYAVYMRTETFTGRLHFDMLALWILSLVAIAVVAIRLRANYDLLEASAK